MKKISILLQLLFVLSFTAFSQNENSFKTLPKTKSGTTHKSMQYKTISHSSANGITGTQSTQKSFTVSQNLQLPSLSNHFINIHYKNGAPIFFEKYKSTPATTKVEEQFYSFHEQAKNKTKLQNPQKELKIISLTTDTLGITHIKSQQYFKDVKVYGAESYLHIGPQKDIFTGSIYSIDTTLQVSPKISTELVLPIVETNLRTKTIVQTLQAKQKEILHYASPQITLVIYNSTLAYEVRIRPNFIEEWKYIVDAQTGNIITSYNMTQSDGPTSATAYDLTNTLRTINTYLENGSYILLNAGETMYNQFTQEGIIQTFDANNTSTTDLNYSDITSTNNTWTNPTAVSALYNTTATYRYLKNTFDRNSINGQGGNIISFINVTEDDGTSMENAFWNGQAAFFGNGGYYFEPLAGGLDVIAHELGHGVVSNTANLDYYDQSGAINETYADIFGSMVDRDDWLIGDDVTKTTFSPSGALRNMADPYNMGTPADDYWQPKYKSEMYNGMEDNGGVHINSGIGNFAYYLFATAVTKEKAEQVFYRALANYLTTRSDFLDLRLAVIQSAKDLYGDSSPESTEAGFAFDSVEIYDDISIDYEQEYDVNPGQEYLLSYDTDPANSNRLYRSSVSGLDFRALSTTLMKGSVSVSDDGSVGVFVAEDGKIKFISTDPNNIDEFDFGFVELFDNVAISKDGNRMAAISTEIDTAIYVYDLETDQWAKFILYNPTTSDNGVNAGGVVYADAIEFDHTGEFLMYDAYNVLNSSSGDDISYWDVNFIQIWNNETNTFGDGNISKLYSSLPENVSIGNAAFSKNSPNIIAFDYIDGNAYEYAVFGANLITGDLDIITANTTLGYPSFSKNDDMVAFTSTSGGDEVIGVKDLASNKITGIGSASLVVNYAKWPVFYSVGTRILELDPIANFTADVKTGIVPLSVQFTDLSINNPTSWYWSFQGGSPSSSNQQNPNIIYAYGGTFQVTLTCTNSVGNNSITKTSYISVSYPESIEQTVTEIFSFYPNPTDGIIFISSEKDFRLKIYSVSGLVLFDITNQKEIDISKLTKGMYIMQIETDGKILTDKIIKQ